MGNPLVLILCERKYSGIQYSVEDSECQKENGKTLSTYLCLKPWFLLILILGILGINLSKQTDDLQSAVQKRILVLFQYYCHGLPKNPGNYHSVKVQSIVWEISTHLALSQNCNSHGSLKRGMCSFSNMKVLYKWWVLFLNQNTCVKWMCSQYSFEIQCSI